MQTSHVEDTSSTTLNGLAALTSTIYEQQEIYEYLFQAASASGLRPSQFSKWNSENNALLSAYDANYSSFLAPELPASIWSVITSEGIPAAEQSYGPSFTVQSWCSALESVHVNAEQAAITILEDILGKTVKAGFMTSTEVEGHLTTTLTISVLYGPTLTVIPSSFDLSPSITLFTPVVTLESTSGRSTVPNLTAPTQTLTLPANHLDRASNVGIKIGVGLGVGLGVSLLFIVITVLILWRKRYRQKQENRSANLESFSAAGGVIEKSELDANNTLAELRAPQPHVHEADGVSRQELDVLRPEADGITRFELDGQRTDGMQRYEIEEKNQHTKGNE